MLSTNIKYKFTLRVNFLLKTLATFKSEEMNNNALFLSRKKIKKEPYYLSKALLNKIY